MNSLTKDEFSKDLGQIIELNKEIQQRGGFLNPFNLELVEVVRDKAKKYADYADQALDETIPDKETMECLLLVQEHRIYELYYDLCQAIEIVKKS